MRMPSSAVVHVHLQMRTVSNRNYTHMLFDITREEVVIRTHVIIHLEHHVET
jgi:hypothetical protein